MEFKMLLEVTRAVIKCQREMKTLPYREMRFTFRHRDILEVCFWEAINLPENV